MSCQNGWPWLEAWLGWCFAPDFNLAQLVRAMASGPRTKLPSISELDPAVSHAVKSCPAPEMYGEMQSTNYHSSQSPNILSSLSQQPLLHSSNHALLSAIPAAPMPAGLRCEA